MSKNLLPRPPFKVRLLFLFLSLNFSAELFSKENDSHSIILQEGRHVSNPIIPATPNVEIPPDVMSAVLRRVDGIPKGSIVSWSRTTFEIELGRRLDGAIVGHALVKLGFVPVDRALPLNEAWDDSMMAPRIMHLNERYSNNEPIYSITPVYRKRNKELNVHGMELKLWERLGRKIKWMRDEDRLSYSSIEGDFVTKETASKLLSRMGNRPELDVLLHPNHRGAAQKLEYPKDPRYWELMKDVLGEIDQLFEEPVRSEMKKIWTAFLETKTLNDPNGYFDDIIPHQVYSVDTNVFEHMQNYKSIESIDGIPHSMGNVDKYVENRLGSSVISHAKQRKLVASVAGWAPSRFIKGENTRAYEIPSFYGSWGYRRFYRPHDQAVVFYTPPVQEAAKTYAYLFDLAKMPMHSSYLDTKARDEYRSMIRAETEQIAMDLPKDGFHLLIGWRKDLFSILKKPNGPFEIMEEWETRSPHMAFNYAKIRNKQTGQISNILNLWDKAFRWGEGTTYPLQTLADAGAISITHLGTAGAPSPKLHINDLSIPIEFYANGTTIPIQNLLQVAKRSMDTSEDDIAKWNNVTVNFRTRHGISDSPAQQTRNFVENELLLNGIDAVDVEQNLVAQFVASHNKRNPTRPILFGAGNVITDKPNSHSHNFQASHDLDALDRKNKEVSQRELLALALESVSKIDEQDVTVPLSRSRVRSKRVQINCRELLKLFRPVLN